MQDDRSTSLLASRVAIDAVSKIELTCKQSRARSKPVSFPSFAYHLSPNRSRRKPTTSVATFYLIDQSLRDHRGHHFDYACNIAQAAKQNGFDTVLGTHRRFPLLRGDEANLCGADCRIEHNFRDTTYQPGSDLAGVQHLTRSRGLKQRSASKKQNTHGLLWEMFECLIQKRQNHKRNQCRERVVRRFAADCQRFFRREVFSDQDQVFFAAISELELLGLAFFLASQPRTMQVQWHLQFHFNLFEGRPPEFEGQERTKLAVQACFQSALSRIPFHGVRFYTTTDELAEQYNRLKVARFETLPYPVSKEFSPKSFERNSSGSAENFDLDENQRQLPPSTSPAPLRLVCPGGIRREKGHANYLQPLVDQLWKPLLASGEAQLWLQRPIRSRWRKQKLELTTPPLDQHEHHQQNLPAPIVYLPHPLSRQDYIELIHATDVGLLFYDSRVYFSRRAGVLGELLSCGKPVVVPAGCWLAEQIQEPIFEHVDALAYEHGNRQLGLNDFRWHHSNVPMSGGILAFDDHKHPFSFEVDREADASAVAMRFDWHWPTSKGIYCRIELTQYGEGEDLLETSHQVVGHRKLGQSTALFNLHPGSKRLQFSLKNALHHSTATIRNASLTMLASPSKDSLDSVSKGSSVQGFPVGAVGAIAADSSQVAACVIEIVDHLRHYRQSAKSFSHDWSAVHQPAETIARLTQADAVQRKVA